MKPQQTPTLENLRNGDQQAFKLLYAFYYPAIERHILRNSGTRDDARDVFQETLLVLIKKLETDNLELTSSLKTYIFSIASHIWLKRLRQNRLLPLDELPEIESDFDCQPDVEPAVSSAHRVNQWLARLSESCQVLLRAIFFLNKNIEQVRQEQQYSNNHSAQNQKYKCLKKLRHEAGNSNDALD